MSDPVPRSDAAPTLPPPRRQVALTPFNTFGLAATARVMYTLDDPGQTDTVLAALAGDVPATGRPLILSGGSNLLLARDLDEPVLLVRTRGRQRLDQDAEHVWLEVAAGEIWHDTVRWSLDQGYGGLENLALIPGRVGAAPWQNIGAYGVEVGDVIESVTAIHLLTGERRCYSRAACAFGYRQSFFKTTAGRDWLIVSVRLRLRRHFVPHLGYGELATAVQARVAAGASLDARLVADTVEAIRRRKLPDPAVLGNAGSFFHNPVVPAGVAERLRSRHPDMPAHPAIPDGARPAGPATTSALPPVDHDTRQAPAPGIDARPGTTVAGGTPGDAMPGQATVKLSAGWLIDQCGWKGHRDGDAGVSPHHALVLVNHGNATGQQILDLAERIQHSVFERFGVLLQPEPVILR